MRFAAVFMIVVALAVPAWAQNRESLQFISVMPDNDYVLADMRLREYLEKTADLTFDDNGKTEYHDAITEVIDRAKDGTPYVARLTPYVYVAAELQGAQFEILGTYLGKATNRGVTYRSYFVVRDEKGAFSEKATVRQIADYLRASERTFAYHDKFSASSYVVPVSFFRKEGLFHIERGTPPGTLKPIAVLPPSSKGMGSSKLIEMVATRQADIAAVWDGTKVEDFPQAVRDGRRIEPLDKAWAPLRFVPLNTTLPNDFLVCSKNLPEKRKSAIRDALRKMNGCPGGIPEFAGDFVCWRPIEKNDEALKALEDLRQSALGHPTPVTVEVALDLSKQKESELDEAARAKYEGFLEVARQALADSGTEFTLFTRPRHSHKDMEWTLEPIHDDAVMLTSAIAIKGVAPQRIPITFTDMEDLRKRLGTIIHTRLHRIRYLWPYDNRNGKVLRDVNFSPASRAHVQRITWIDPAKYSFTDASPRELEIQPGGMGAYYFEVDTAGLEKSGDELKFVDPLSNSAYRVVLLRPETERPLFQWLTLGLVILFALAGMAAIFDLARGRRQARAEPVIAPQPAPALPTLVQ